MEATAQGTTRSGLVEEADSAFVRLDPASPTSCPGVSHAYLPGAILGPLTACRSIIAHETSLRLWACHIIPSLSVRHSLNPFA